MARLVDALGLHPAPHRIGYLAEEQPVAAGERLHDGLLHRRAHGRLHVLRPHLHDIGLHGRERRVRRVERHERGRRGSLSRLARPRAPVRRRGAVLAAAPAHTTSPAATSSFEHRRPKVAHPAGEHVALPGRCRQKHALELGDDLGNPFRPLERSPARAHALQIQHIARVGARRHRAHGGARLRERARPQAAEHLRRHPGALGPRAPGRGPDTRGLRAVRAAEPALHDLAGCGQAAQALARHRRPDAEARCHLRLRERAVRAGVARDEAVERARAVARVRHLEERRGNPGGHGRAQRLAQAPRILHGRPALHAADHGREGALRVAQLFQQGAGLGRGGGTGRRGRRLPRHRSLPDRTRAVLPAPPAARPPLPPRAGPARAAGRPRPPRRGRGGRGPHAAAGPPPGPPPAGPTARPDRPSPRARPRAPGPATAATPGAPRAAGRPGTGARPRSRTGADRQRATGCSSAPPPCARCPPQAPP